MIQAEEARKIIEKQLAQISMSDSPAELYDPIRYVLDVGGKRIRPVLCMMSCSLFTEDVQRSVPAATSLEVFHNFTLLHDDFMDDAPMRRNRTTVHVKWNPNVAILSGDAMLIKAYELLSASEKEILPDLLEIFTKTALEVCEGQQLDMNFEDQTLVSEQEYLRMIELKTAVLLAASMKMGAISGRADSKTADILYEAGRLTGLAFQLQDDLLDTFGDAESFGKQIGGDITANKKTWLYIKTLELMKDPDREELLDLYSGKSGDSMGKIQQVKNLFSKYGTDQLARKLIQRFSGQAMDHIHSLSIPGKDKDTILSLILDLMGRKV